MYFTFCPPYDKLGFLMEYGNKHYSKFFLVFEMKFYKYVTNITKNAP